MIVDITEKNFEEEVLNSKIPVVLDFWTSWCGPCKMMHQVFDEVEQEVGERLKIGRINIDVEAGLAQRFNIISIPSFVFYKGGERMNETIEVGLMAIEKFLPMAESYVGNLR